ncbi:DsbA family protein [Dyadobacter soli]|uniref:DsbA family protein n=1 Tax=Dyadobacter soli TaxID=659014 RepID=UPI00159FFC89|nr:thioredoxin domain-containing protein [Dyadobacter soli]
MDRRVAGEAAGQVIYVDEVDDLIQNSLYEYLFAIFDARSIATNELINSRLLEIEARTRGLTIDSLLSIETARIGKVETKSKYIRDNALHGGVIEEKSPFKVHQPDSEIGKKILDNSYRKFLKVRFIETLRAKYKTKVLLARPQPPAIGLDDVRIYARGNENSKTCITIVSDFDCSACRRAYPEFRKVFERYRDQVRFEAVNLSQNVTWAILLAECAGEQGNFWNAYEALYSENYHRTDRDSLIRILGLNRNECIACLESSRMNSKITTSMAQLHSCGIEVTPTVLIDRRTYYGPLESGAIGRFLDDLLLQKQND